MIVRISAEGQYELSENDVEKLNELDNQAVVTCQAGDEEQFNQAFHEMINFDSLKSKAEDVSNGTITLPVAKAMSRLPEVERAWVWRTLSSKPKDAAVVAEVVAKLEGCGAVEAVSQQARDLVEEAWKRASPLLDDSFSKVMFRAFGWYVLERHY